MKLYGQRGFLRVYNNLYKCVTCRKDYIALNYVFYFYKNKYKKCHGNYNKLNKGILTSKIWLEQTCTNQKARVQSLHLDICFY